MTDAGTNPFWAKTEFPDGKWVVVYKNDPNVVLHPNDEMAIFPLMLYLWNKNHSFFLGCSFCNNGRVTAISDNYDTDAVIDIAFHSRTFHWCNRETREEMFYSGYQNLLISDLSAHPPIGLSHLKRVVLNMPFHSFEPIFSWMIDKHLPGFSDLVISYKGDVEDEYIESVLTILRNLDIRLAKKLNFLMFNNMYKFNENHLETLFVNILPMFTNLEILWLDCIDTANLQRGLSRIMADKIPLKSLRQFKLGVDGRLVTSLFEDPNTKATMVKFLRTFNTITELGSPFVTDPKLLYALITNHMGRRLLEGDGNGNDIDSENLPRSVWPLVLKRAQTLPAFTILNILDDDIKDTEAKCNNCATGIYYVLREGPIFRSGSTPGRVSNGE